LPHLTWNFIRLFLDEIVLESIKIVNVGALLWPNQENSGVKQLDKYYFCLKLNYVP